MTFTKISLTNQVDRQLIAVEEAVERYVLLTLTMPKITNKVSRLPLNLSLIIDRSGSMSGNKLEYVKEAAIHALRLLSAEDRVSVITYDDEVAVVAPNKSVTNETRQEIIRLIREVKTGGMTNLSGGWLKGCDQIADFMTADYLNRALLLTDGLANAGLTDHEKLVMEAKELRKRGISTTTFGVGTDFNQFLLQGIADNGGGHFYFIDHPKQIPNYFEGELGEMLTTVVREITLEIGLLNGVELSLLNDLPAESAPHGWRIFLGDAYSGEQRTLALKLKLPPCQMGQSVTLSLALKYEDIQQHQSVTFEAESIRFTTAGSNACENQPTNEAVVKMAGQLEVERAKVEAMKREYDGDVAGAQQVLQRAASGLVGIMPAPMAAAFSKSLAEEADEIAAGRDESIRKTRHYDSYRTQHTRQDYKK